MEKQFESEKKEFDWEQDGFVIYRGLIPKEDVRTYIEYMEETFFNQDKRSKDDDYIRHPEIRDLLCHKNIAQACEEIGVFGGVHANLINWIYEGVGYHTDVTSQSMTRIFGVWIALDHIPREAGTLIIFPGSHKWDIDMSKCEPGYRGETNQYVYDVIDYYDVEPYYFDAEEGDVLIWDSRCMHRRDDKKNNTPRKAAVTLCAKEKIMAQHKDGLHYCP